MELFKLVIYRNYIRRFTINSLKLSLSINNANSRYKLSLTNKQTMIIKLVQLCTVQTHIILYYYGSNSYL